ncbi:uncharacterized protein LOC109856311 [Pseudomyrmex gracilis]|uniref:uncharacterized protein LOC109856311 n=1 Tax=Pseudomyrmex gracilis TaxID=219809 RepID=UPI000995B962|nr:uncharacterized protein LOC109856311 [Pseudomyrmex gracilis]
MSYNGNNNNNSFPRKRGFGPRGAHGKGIFRSRFLHPPLRHVAPPLRHGQPRPLGWKLNNVFYPPFRGNPKFRPHNGRGRGIGNIRFPPPHRLPVPPNYMFEDDIILDDNEETHVNSTPLLPLPGSEEERQLKITEAADRLKQKLSFSKDKEHNIHNEDDVPDPLEDDCLRNNQTDFDVTCNDLKDERNINPDNLRPDIIQHHEAESEEFADCRRNDVILNENEHGSQLEETNDQVRNLDDFSGYEVIDRWDCDESVDNSCNLEQSTLYQESNIVESRSLDLNLQCQYDESLTDNVQDQCGQQQDIPQDVSHEVPQDILQDIPQDVSHDIPQDIHCQDVFCQNISQDTFQNVSEENEVNPTDVVIEQQSESETPIVQEVSFLPNPIDQIILQDEQEPVLNPENREDALNCCVYPEKSDCNDDCTLEDCTLPESVQVEISVLNDVTSLDNQSSGIHDNSFHSGPPNLSPPVDTTELELPADFDPTTPPPILLKQDQPRALPLPLDLPPLFNPAEPPPNMRHLIGPTTSPCENMNHPWNINNQNPIPYNAELNVHVGFTSPMSFEMTSPNNVYLSPIVGANNFSSFVPMMPNNHPVINANIPPVMQPSSHPAINTNIPSHMQIEIPNAAPQLQVVPFAQLTEPSVPPPPPEDSKDDGLNDMEEAMKFAEQMTSLTASKPEQSESSSLIENSSVNIISNIETIELPPEKPKTKSKKLKRKTTDDTKVPEEKTPSKHLPSVETTTPDATERSKDSSLIPDDHRPKVVFNLNNTSKLVRSTITRQQESVNETANNKKSSIQSVESKRTTQARPSVSDRNLENTRQNKESNRNSKRQENKPDGSKATANPNVVSRKKKQENSDYAEKSSGVASVGSLKSRVAEQQDESNKSAISDTTWKDKVINRLLKMSTNEIYNLVNNTSLRKFNLVMKRLVKEKKSTLSLEKRHEQDEKMKMYDRQEFIKHLNAMLDTDAVVSITDLPTEFIQHLNEALQMNVQTNFQAESAASAATAAAAAAAAAVAATSGQSSHSDAANYVSNPTTQVAEYANRTALSVNDVGQECARTKSDAKTRYAARGAKTRNCKSNNSNLRTDTPPNSSSGARTLHAIKSNDVSARTDVAAARVQDVVIRNNVNPQHQNDTSSIVASSSDSICNNLLSLQHDVDDIFSEVTKKYQQPADKKKRARCSTSDDGTVFARAQDNFDQSLTRNTENCIRWLEGCDRWKKKEREEPRYRNLTREEWLAKYGTQANPTSPVTTTLTTTTTLPTTTLPTTAQDTARFAHLSKQQTKKYPLQRRYSSESLRFNARQSRSLERDQQTQPRRHSDERRHVARCSENDRDSSSSSNSTSDSGNSNDNNNTNVTKLLRVIKENEKVAKKRSLNEQMRDEINAEIEQERKRKAKRSRKKNSKHKREKRLRHKKKKSKKAKSFTNSSGSDEEESEEETPTRLLTADEIKKEVDDQQVAQQVMIKEEVDIGQDENIETTFANAIGSAIPMENRPSTCLSSRGGRLNSPATRENPAATINTVQLLVAEDRRLQTTPASPTTKTKAQLKQMPETTHRNEGKIRPNVFTSVPRDTISAANLAANLEKPCPTATVPVRDDNKIVDVPSTSIANSGFGRNPDVTIDNNAQESARNATAKLLPDDVRASDRRDEKRERASSESSAAAINTEADNKICEPTISLSVADVASSAEEPTMISMDVSADTASQKSSKKIDLKTYYERTIRRRISEQSKKRNVKNESIDENPDVETETSELSAATVPQRDNSSKSKRSSETKAAPTTRKKSKSPADAKKFINIRSEGSKELRLKRLSNPIKKGKRKTASKCATNPVSTDINNSSLQETTETIGDTTKTEDKMEEKTIDEKEIDNIDCHGNHIDSANNNANSNVDKAVEVQASNNDGGAAINELSTNCLEKIIDNIDDRKLLSRDLDDKPEECSATNKEKDVVEQRNVDDADNVKNNSEQPLVETATRESVEETTCAGNDADQRRAASGCEVIADGETRKDEDDASTTTATTTTTTTTTTAAATATESNVVVDDESKPLQKNPRKLKRKNLIPSSQAQIEKSNNHQSDTTENKNATPRSTRDIDSQNKENRELISASATSNINNKEVNNAKPMISKDVATCNKPASKNDNNSLVKKAIKMSSENVNHEHQGAATSADNNPEVLSPESLASNPFKGFLQEPVMDFEQSGLFNFSLNEIDTDKSKLFLHDNSINSIVTQTVNSTMMKLERPRENYDDEIPTDYTEDVDIGTGENFNIGFSSDTLLAADKECATSDEKPDALTDADECGEVVAAIKSPSEIVGTASLHVDENNDANSSETDKQLTLKDCLSTASMFVNEDNDEELSIRDASRIKNLKSKLKTATDPSLSDALDTAAVSDDNLRLTETTHQVADHLNNPMYLETDASSEKTCDKLPDFDSDAQLDNMFYLDERLPSATEFDNKDDASFPVNPPSPPQYGLVPAVIPPEMTTITSCGGMLSPDEVRKTERYNLKPADNDLMIGAPAAGHSPAGAEETRTSSVIPTKAALKEVVATNDFARLPTNLSAERAALEMFEKEGTSGGEDVVAPNYQTSALPAWHVSETRTDARETHVNADFVNINMVSSTQNNIKIIDECARKKTSVNNDGNEPAQPTSSVNVAVNKLFNLQRKPVVELTKMKEVENLLLQKKSGAGRCEKKYGSKEQRDGHKRGADSALHRLKDKLSMKNRSGKTSEDSLMKKLKDMKKSKTPGGNARETILARMLEIDMKIHNLMVEKLKLHELLHGNDASLTGVNDASRSVANNTAAVTSVITARENNTMSVQSGTSPITQLSPNAETTTNRAKQDKHSSTSLSRRSSSKQRKRNISHSSEEDEIANFTHKSKMPVIKWKKKPRLELNSSRGRRDDDEDDEDDDVKTKEKEKMNAKTERRVALAPSQKKPDDPVDNRSKNNQESESSSVLDVRDARTQEPAAKIDDNVVDKTPPSTCASKNLTPDKTNADNRSERPNSVEREETEHVDVDKRSETRTPSECAKTCSRPSSRQVHSTPEPIYTDDSTWDSMVQNTVSETHENRKTISPLVLLDESLKKEMAKSRKMKAMMRKKKKKQLDIFLNSVNKLTEEEEELPLSCLYIRKLQQKRDLLDSLSDKKKDTKDRTKNLDEATNAVQTDKAEENPQEENPQEENPQEENPQEDKPPQPEAPAPNDISTSNVSSVLQPSHQFCIDAEANANSDWPSSEKENVGEVAPQDNNDANSSSDYVFRSVSQNRVTFQDERNMEPDSSVTPEDTLIEKHSADNELIENSRTRSGSMSRDDRSKDRNKIPDIKVSVPKTLIDDDFSVRLLQKFKETETGVDSTSSSALPANAEKVEEINKQSEIILETETKSTDNNKSEEAKETDLIEEDKDKNEDSAKDPSPAVEENTCALQEKEATDDGTKDVPSSAQSVQLDYSEPEKETSSTDSVESNEKMDPTTDAARDSHNTDVIAEETEPKKSDAESEQSSNDDAIATKLDEQNMEVATAEQEERIDSDDVPASSEKIVPENSGDIVPASDEKIDETADTPVESTSSLESTSASSLKEIGKNEEMNKKPRRKQATSVPTRRSHRHISENVKLTRTGSTESSESKGKISRRKRKHTEWQMMNCKVKVIDCKYTFLKPNVSSRLLEKYGLIHVNSYPSDSYKLPAQRAVSHGDHPALMVSEDDSSQSASCDKDISELEVLEEKLIKKTGDSNIVQEPALHAATTDDQQESMRIQYNDHTGPILDIKVFENSFLAASEDGKIYRYSRTSDRILNIYKGHKSAVTCLHINTDAMNKKFVYSGSLDGNLRCYNIMTGELMKNSVQINSAIQCMDEAWGLIFIGTKSGNVSRFNIKAGCIKGSNIHFSEMSVLALKATNEGSRRILIVASRSQPITIRDAQTGLFLRTISSQKNHTVYSLMRHQGLIYCGTSSTSINVFDFTTGEQTIQYKAGVGIVCMRLHKQLLFAGCYDGNIYIFDTRNHKLVCTIPGPGNMLLSIEVIDNKIIAGSKDKRLHLWQMPTEVCALL